MPVPRTRQPPTVQLIKEINVGQGGCVPKHPDPNLVVACVMCCSAYLVFMSADACLMECSFSLCVNSLILW